MPVPFDPYRTLGLHPGAPIVEVKRAYRRLAKELHPDAGGPAALPRFLAVQAAYEAILGQTRRRVPGGRRRTAETRGTEGTRGTAGATGSAGGDGRAGTTGDRGASAGWRREPGWGSGRRRAERDEAGRRDGRQAGETGEGRARPGRSRAGRGANGERGADAEGTPRPAAAARSSTGSPGRRPRRSPNRATFGSTTYDDAEEAEPTWDGAGWYGPAMGTYWTLNPREYADPRKHGPEYAARARAAALGGPGRVDAAAGPPETDEDPMPAEEPRSARAAPSTSAGPVGSNATPGEALGDAEIASASRTPAAEAPGPRPRRAAFTRLRGLFGPGRTKA